MSFYIFFSQKTLLNSQKDLLHIHNRYPFRHCLGNSYSSTFFIKLLNFPLGSLQVPSAFHSYTKSPLFKRQMRKAIKLCFIHFLRRSWHVWTVIPIRSPSWQSSNNSPNWHIAALLGGFPFLCNFKWKY